MKIYRIIIVSLSMITFPLMACSRNNSEEMINHIENTQNPTDFQTQILDFIERRNKAMIDKNISTLSKMMADDLVLAHITGRRQTKQEWLNDIENERIRYFNIETKNLNINKIDENTATATYQSVITANIYGSQGTWTLNINQKFIKTDNDWLWINS